jgi:hypothetical protein
VTERAQAAPEGGWGNPLASPAVYFRPERHETLHQGDILLAPCVTVWSAASKPAPATSPGLELSSSGEALLTPWPSDQDLEAPADLLAPPPVTLEVAFRPVMVLSHECEIEKEFNEYVARREAESGPEVIERAKTEANDRWDLDRYVLVAPLIEYTPAAGTREAGAAADKWAAIQAGQKIGYFPVLPLPGASPAVPTFVHLSRVSTVERRLLAYARTLVSLTPAAVFLLRVKLAEVHSVRNLAVVSKLEAALGRTIMDVKTLKQGRSTASVALVLDDGTDLAVDVKADPKATRPERTRGPRR